MFSSGLKAVVPLTSDQVALGGRKPMSDVAPGRYRHYKGREYIVLGVAKHSETQEDMVVYRQEYGDHGLWVRPMRMFQETVKVDGKEVSRFQLLPSISEGGQSHFADIPKHLPE